PRRGGNRGLHPRARAAGGPSRPCRLADHASPAARPCGRGVCPGRRQGQQGAEGHGRTMSEVLVEIVVEWPARTAERHEWIEASGELIHVATDKFPPPEHYGCVPGAISPGDDELLDVLLLDEGPRGPGERVQARLIGVLRRSDGD